MKNFTLGDRTGLFSTCSVIYKGKMMVFGGHINQNYARQISEINPNGICGIRRINNVKLEKDFIAGGCNVVTENDREFVILCFSLIQPTICYR